MNSAQHHTQYTQRATARQQLWSCVYLQALLVEAPVLLQVLEQRGAVGVLRLLQRVALLLGAQLQALRQGPLLLLRSWLPTSA